MNKMQEYLAYLGATLWLIASLLVPERFHATTDLYFLAGIVGALPWAVILVVKDW